MIDWSKLKWTKQELEGIGCIALKPRVLDDKIVIQTEWFNQHGEIVRRDVHAEILELPALTGAAGEF